jgi:hypothetical protein
LSSTIFDFFDFFLKIFSCDLLPIMVEYGGCMAKKKILTVQKGVRFPKWMAEAIEEIAEKGGHTFTDVVLDLLRQELNFMGYSMGIGREADAQKEKPAKKKAV